ncbi:hypothetical protein G3I59_46420 [Amycolatopsis rubida]|uniref:Uncharacterized protein n=1 Tax=Amycolatopsis rubida TaxID=112413 RepID=A0ABX0C7N1_9PSEU|nr:MULTISPECIES: hypothetical protein [Amycolatopsis]MYW97854.1 hypothetical protein [Amycolatopsis rubida]NEC62840.1 hypothetical protein [Amycolatopsis rubida]OAP24021.1 hypothetical protein A4R44_05176 [Amycolatopsis sp. M39]
METWTDRLLRWWHLLVPGPGSVARASDRFQSGLLLAALLVALTALPFAAAVGSELYGTRKPVSAGQLTERNQATAILLTDGPATTVNGRSGLAAGRRDLARTGRFASNRPGRGRRRRAARRPDFDLGGPRGKPRPAAADRRGGAGRRGVRGGRAVGVGVLGAGPGVGGTVFALNRRRRAEWQREWDAEQAKRTHP